MPSVKRKFPRVSFNLATELSVRPRVAKGPPPEQIRMRGSIRAMSCDGAGVSLTEPGTASMRRGDQVTLSFFAVRKNWLLPGKIVWSVSAAERPRAMHVGIRFHLELAPLQTRQAFARWIVAESEQARF